MLYCSANGIIKVIQYKIPPKIATFSVLYTSGACNTFELCFFPFICYILLHYICIFIPILWQASMIFVRAVHILRNRMGGGASQFITILHIAYSIYPKHVTHLTLFVFNESNHKWLIYINFLKKNERKHLNKISSILCP